MKIQFQKTLHPVYFYGLMVIFFALSQYFISNSCQPIYPNYYLDSVLRTGAKVAGAEAMNCDCEVKFQKSYPVIWVGHVSATFAGGEDIAVKTYDPTDKYHQFYVIGNGLYNYDLGEEVRVVGKLIGLTCAYANTVSNGCMGEVSAEKIIAIEK
jgi:hypothetical protein